jgi:hypothetical protein
MVGGLTIRTPGWISECRRFAVLYKWDFVHANVVYLLRLADDALLPPCKLRKPSEPFSAARLPSTCCALRNSAT